MEIDPEEIVKLKATPFQLFLKGCKTDATRHDYTYALRKLVCQYLNKVLEGDPELVMKTPKPDKHRRGRYLEFSDADFEQRVNELVNRSKHNREWVETVLLKLVDKFVERSKLPKTDPDYAKPSSCRPYLKAARKLFVMNNILINWNLIENSIPRDEINEKTREYTLKEIQDLLPHCKIMDKVLVLLAASSGIREGGFALKWGDMMPVYSYEGKFLWEYHDVTESVSKYGVIVCAIIKVYANSSEEYVGFVTPECWKTIQEYRKSWINEIGKEPRPEDPLFKTRHPFVKELTIGGIKSRMLRLLENGGFRTKLPKGVKHYEVPLFNGFRRFFNKANKRALSKNSPLSALIMKESMMGHDGLIRLDKNYFKSHVDELIEEYLQAIPFLTISDEERKDIELKKERLEMGKLKQINEDLKKKYEMKVEKTVNARLEQFEVNFKKEVENWWMEQMKKSVGPTLAQKLIDNKLSDRFEKARNSKELAEVINQVTEIVDTEHFKQDN